jgi:ribosomal-protein-alanine acetyltransferase
MNFEKMSLDHIDGVMEVEHLSFALPWSKNSFIQEVTSNQFAHYIVAMENDKVIGYAGMWQIQDEGHITNVAVHPDFRGLHIGKGLMKELIDTARGLGIDAMTLEVRKSNEVAKNLYKSFDFFEAGVRKRYYSDNNEDAVIMWNKKI